MSAPLMLRFAVDDLKAAYIEVALSGSAKPSSKQLGDWWWNDTAAGAAILAGRVGPFPRIARAEQSNGREENGVDSVILQVRGDFAGVAFHLHRIGYGRR